MKNQTNFIALLFCTTILLSCNDKKKATTNESESIDSTTKQVERKYPTDVTSVNATNSEPENVASLEALFSKKETYATKNIIIKGEVTKINNGIMERNWVHISDGTQFEDKKTLTVTTKDSLNIGDQVTFEGILILNKDFGSGYVYDILLENGKLLEHTPFKEASKN